MKSLFYIVLFLMADILNSCEIANKTSQNQVNTLTTAQQLQHVSNYVAEKTIRISFDHPMPSISGHDSIRKNVSLLTVPEEKSITQIKTVRKSLESVAAIPVHKIKTIGYSILKPRFPAAGYSKNANTESNIFSKLATVFLILTLAMIVLLFVGSDSSLALVGTAILLGGLFLFLCLLFFIIGLIHKKD